MVRLKRFLKPILPDWLFQLGRKIFYTLLQMESGFDHYQVLSPENLGKETGLRDAWKDQSIPEAQRSIVNKELVRMYQGDIVTPYRVLKDAVRETGCENGQIIEVGCASAYYSEVLFHLLGHPIDYVGIDYSAALLDLGRRYYPDLQLLLGDATALPFHSDAADILISGCVLLHLDNYRHAIAESARVSRKWVIFHRTPIVAGPTIYYTKLAYGVKCLEIAFGADELLNVFRENGLTVKEIYEIGQNTLPCTSLRGRCITYLCRIE